MTGATGFLGRNVLDVLRHDASIEVHAVIRSEAVATANELVWHRGDVLDHCRMSEIVGQVRPSHLMHLAWIGGEHMEARYQSPMNETWASASAHLFRAFADAGGERLVNAGTCLEYGGDPPPWDENASIEPDTPYGRGKLAASLAALCCEELSVAVGRIFFTYGPYEDRRRLVPDVVISLLRGIPVSLSSGRQRRDYLHMADVAAALVGLLGNSGVGVYNIGAGVSWPVAELATIIGQSIGREDLLRFGERPAGPDTAADLVSVPDRLMRELGWHPRFTLEAGLMDVIEWWREELRRTGMLT